MKPKSFPCPMQQGFQKNLSCLTASFSFFETVYHNLELDSKVFVAFLDSKKSFDTVWRKTLVVKLYNLDIKGKTWRLINMFYTDTQ